MIRLIIGVLLGTGLVSCHYNNVDKADLGELFAREQVTGCFGLFDNASGQFTIHNISRFRDSAYLPASTFKIVHALIGIQTGRVRDENAVFPWDGMVRAEPGWNQDLSMKQAFRLSSVPWFQQLARSIGKDTMQAWLDTLGYGRLKARAVISRIDTFWLDNSLKVTADEQLGLVKRLYFNQLPFFNRSMEIVRDMMLMEDNANYRLSYKTGWGKTEAGHSLGWIVGWIEENRRPYFFVLQVETPDGSKDVAAIRMRMLKEILAKYGFMEGKK